MLIASSSVVIHDLDAPRRAFCESRFFTGALGGIRTPDPQIRSLVLYPAELRARHWRAEMERVRWAGNTGVANGSGFPIAQTGSSAWKSNPACKREFPGCRAFLAKASTGHFEQGRRSLRSRPWRNRLRSTPATARC